MVLEERPLKLLVKPPVPVPLSVLEFAIVGFDDVLQHTPLAVTVAPPSPDTFPPLTAELVVIEEIEVVVRTGRVAEGAEVVNET